MGSKGDIQSLLSKDKIVQAYKEFMTRITEFEELVSVGSKLLMGFHQALGFLSRPPIDKASTLVEGIVKAHGTRRLMSYVKAGCANADQKVQSVNKLHVCHLGLQDHIKNAKCIISELGCLLDDARSLVKITIEQDEDVNHNLDYFLVLKTEEDVSSSDKVEVADYANAMAVIYSMVKQDFTMQDRIVSSLNMKTSSGDVESYCQLWSLRPFVDDEIMHEAWSLVKP